MEIYFCLIPNIASATPKKYTICAIPNSGAITIIRHSPPLKNAVNPSFLNVLLKLNKQNINLTKTKKENR